jgi:hypothetical protein
MKKSAPKNCLLFVLSVFISGHVMAQTTCVPGVAIFGPSNTCSGGPPLLVFASSTNGGTSPTYQWYVNGNLQVGQSTNNLVIPTNTLRLGGNQVSVTMTSNASCASPTTASAQWYGNVLPNGPVNITCTANPTTFCKSDTATFKAIYPPLLPSTPPTFQWLVNANQVQGATNDTYHAIFNKGDVVSVTMTQACVPSVPVSSTPIVLQCPTVTGIENDLITTSKKVEAIYNMQGMRVDENETGLLIYHYTDGSTQKVVKVQ